MRVTRWFRTILKYGAGLLFWLIVFGLLRYHCVFDISSVVDRLWVKDLHDGLVKNMTGDIAFHVQAGRCLDRYLYTARYHPFRTDIEGESRSLTSLVDAATWRPVGSEGNVATYLDAKHKYNLYIISDDEYIKAVDR